MEPENNSALQNRLALIGFYAKPEIHAKMSEIRFKASV
jgi:hypothetical protein